MDKTVIIDGVSYTLVPTKDIIPASTNTDASMVNISRATEESLRKVIRDTSVTIFTWCSIMLVIIGLSYKIYYHFKNKRC